MKKSLFSFICLLFVTLSFAQTNDTEIKQIQNYIQTTSQNEWFDPINKSGTLENGISYDLAYYILPNNETFSIIYTVFDKTTLRKVFYFKESKIIACIIEETDANNANKLLRYADYFYKDGTLMNPESENKDFPSVAIHQEGLDKNKQAPQLNN